jgi:hypothetical protein
VRLQALDGPGSGVHAFARTLDARLFALKVARWPARALPAARDRSRARVQAAFDHRRSSPTPRRLAHRDYRTAISSCDPAAPRAGASC